ncbi:MAG: hypothetical protein JWR69_323, partial [Pedosphaera sp.]|nr:hypothetical protein [Pedosphaera sp.]
DFSDQSAWEGICATIGEPAGDLGFLANVECVDDAEYDGVRAEQLLKSVPEDYPFSFIMLLDHTAISQPDHPLLIIDLLEEPGREFRAIPSQIQSIENNLSIANMGFEEFADAADESGVFRGFPGS